MYRDEADVSVSSRLFRGAFVSAYLLAPSLSSFSVTATSMTAARSSLDAALNDTPSRVEIEGLDARRDLLVQHYEALVRERSESAVLYTPRR